VKTYLVEKSNQLLELLSVKEISRRLEAGELNPALRMYDDAHGGWIRFFDHPNFQKKSEVEKPKPRLQLVPATPQEWYYLQGQTPIGAFSYMEMIGLLQRKQITLSSSVWRRGQPNWAEASSLEEFQSAIVQQLRQTTIPGLDGYFARRQFKRFPYAAKFILHNEDKLWRAISFELSMGGIGLLANTDVLGIGQEVFIHKTSRGAEVDINAVACVRSKFTQGMQLGQAKYGLEFVDISKDTQLEIEHLGTKVTPQLQASGGRK
jgi:hypothetical protein